MRKEEYNNGWNSWIISRRVLWSLTGNVSWLVNPAVVKKGVILCGKHYGNRYVT